jgi:hypothetical protein
MGVREILHLPPEEIKRPGLYILHLKLIFTWKSGYSQPGNDGDQGFPPLQKDRRGQAYPPLETDMEVRVILHLAVIW